MNANTSSSAVSISSSEPEPCACDNQAVKLVIEGKSYRLNGFMMSTESLTAESPSM